MTRQLIGTFGVTNGSDQFDPESTPLNAPFDAPEAVAMTLFVSKKLPALRSLAAFSVAVAAFFTTPVAAISWQPSSFQWACVNQANNEKLCSLTIVGAEPSGVGVPPDASGWFRIHRGTVAGSGAVLATIPFTFGCVRVPPNLRCEGANVLKLGVGVIPAFETNASSGAISISGNPTAGPLFDWNSDNAQSGTVEGLLALRYVLGLRGTTLFQDINLPAGSNVAEIERQIEMGALNDWYSFTTPPSSTLDGGIMFARCLLGFRGSALVDGFTADATIATNRCEALTALE